MTQPPGRRPDGTVRELVTAHLQAHPDSDFSPMELHRVLATSRGAIIRACQQLAADGHIRRTQNRPQRYQAAPANPTPSPGTTPGMPQAGDLP